MVGKAYGRIFIAFGKIAKFERALIEVIAYLDFHVAGIPLFAVLAYVAEIKLFSYNLAFENLFIEPDFAAVQAVVAVVFEKLIIFTVQREFRAAYSVCHAPDKRAQISVVSFIARNVVITENHVAFFAVLIGYENVFNRAAVIENMHAYNAVV